MNNVLIIGAGRAGSSMARALREVGYQVEGPVGRGYDVTNLDRSIDTVIIATSDSAIAGVASRVEVNPERLVVHLSGSLGTEVLSPHVRRGTLHPLVPLPTVELGAARLKSGITFAVAGDDEVRTMVERLGGKIVDVADEDRARYHAAACVAANHVVALLGHVERVAASAGLPLDAFLDLTRSAIDDVESFGPRNALTGPVARGDWSTLEVHLDAMDPAERASYRAGVGMALELLAGGTDQFVAEEPVEDAPEVRSASGASLVS
jgi:predicted short-subunit dehydrogenase-like oxidoreductase (DUF2520 family)